MIDPFMNVVDYPQPPAVIQKASSVWSAATLGLVTFACFHAVSHSADPQRLTQAGDEFLRKAGARNVIRGTLTCPKKWRNSSTL